MPDLVQRARLKRLVVSTLVLALAGLAGCSADAPDVARVPVAGIDLRMTPADGGGAPCRVERVARIDQAVSPLSTLRGQGLYRAPNGIERSIPVQIRFVGGEGVVEDRAITRTELDADCASVTIALRIDECTDLDRETVTCPEVRISGQDAFAGLLVGRVD